MIGGDRPWRLPANMQFFIWPKYNLIVEGLHVRLRRSEAELLLFLMSHPGRRFSSREISSDLYRDRENGGPTWENTISVQITHAKAAFRAVGMVLDLKAKGQFQGYTFHEDSITLLPETRAELVRRKAELEAMPPFVLRSQAEVLSEAASDKALRVSRKIAKAAVKRKAFPKRVEREPVDVHAFEDRFAGTSGWVFPERVEEETWRRRRD